MTHYKHYFDQIYLDLQLLQVSPFLGYELTVSYEIIKNQPGVPSSRKFSRISSLRQAIPLCRQTSRETLCKSVDDMGQKLPVSPPDFDELGQGMVC